MISANLDKMSNKDERCKEGELVDHYRLRISCGDINAAMFFCAGGRYEEMADGLRKMASILEGKAV